MIRASIFIWVALGGIAGAGVFHLKQAVQSMDDELLRLNRQIAAEHQTIHLMRAQWSRSNQPQHVESLARVALDLEPMKPGQMSRLGDIPFRPVAARPQAEPAVAARGVPAASAPPPPPPAPPAPPVRARVQASAKPSAPAASAPAVASLADAGPATAARTR